MSDHEGGGVDDWEDVSLPGGPTYSYGAHDSIASQINPRASDFSINQRFHQPTLTSQHNQDRPEKPPARLADNYRPLIQHPAARLNAGNSYSRRATYQPTHVQNAARERHDSRAIEDGTYQLSVTYQMLLQNIRDPYMQASDSARHRLNEICHATDTYIPTPDYSSNLIKIWGTETQVEQALDHLALFERDIRDTKTRPSQESWFKLNALDGRKESRLDRVAQAEEKRNLQLFCAQETQWNNTAYLILPEEHNFANWALHEGASLVDQIHMQYVCRIEADEENSQVMICANREGEVREIYDRVFNLVKEFVALNRPGFECNLYELPSVDIYRHQVGLDKSKDEPLILPTLMGDELPNEEKEEFIQLTQQVHARNLKVIKGSLDKRLKALQLTKRLVRMRATFGEHGFYRYEAKGDRKNILEFDHFCDMVTDHGTTMNQQFLRFPRAVNGAFSKSFEQLAQFTKPSESLIIEFRFSGVDQAIQLKHESEYDPTDDGTEYNIVMQRWTEEDTNRNYKTMHAKVLDFEKPNFSISIDVTKEYPNDKVPTKLKNFINNIKCDPPKKGETETGLGQKRTRRVKYPPGHYELISVTEIQVTRYYFHDGPGIFELRQYDQYEGNISNPLAPTIPRRAPAANTVHNGNLVKSSPRKHGGAQEKEAENKGPTSKYLAHYYYPEWDNLMAQFAYLRPGEDVSWDKSLATFFPRNMEYDDARALPRGFKTFMKEVEEIQCLLGDAMDAFGKPPSDAGSASGKGKGKDKDRATAED